MICYLPFTYIPLPHLSVLTSQIGPVRVYSPHQSLVPDHMRAAAEQGAIELRPLAAVDPGRLLPAIQAFKQWAELHQGNLADMAGFFKAAQGRFPMMDETNPSQITTQIRKFGDSGSDPDQDQDPLLQAAIFLSMAEEYDQQQEDMRNKLGAVQSMEREMLERLSGDDRASAESRLGPTPSGPLVDLEPGGYMTEARVQAWAQLAGEDDQPAAVYLTGSPAVMDHLLNLFPRAEAIGHLGFACDDVNAGKLVGQRRDALNRLAKTPMPQPEVLEGFKSAADDVPAGLTLYKLPGIASRVMLKRLRTSTPECDTATGGDDGENHVLIGLVEIQ